MLAGEKEKTGARRGSEIGYLFFSSRRQHTRYWRDWSSDVCSSDLLGRRVRLGNPCLPPTIKPPAALTISGKSLLDALPLIQPRNAVQCTTFRDMIWQDPRSA